MPTLGCVSKPFPFVAVALLLAIGLNAGPGWAFDAMRTPDGRVVHAPRTPWPVFLQAAGFDGLSLAKVESVVEDAIQTWNAVPGTRVELVYGGLVKTPPRTGVYLWRDPGFNWRGTEVLAQPTLEWDQDGALTLVSIALNGQDFRFVTVTKAQASVDGRGDADLGVVVTHQLGHALGLSHSRDPDAVMYFWQTTEGWRTLRPDDESALRFVYPAADVSRTETCDPCRSDADCTGNQRCLAWPDGFAYCAADCATHDDCPAGTSCGTYSGGTGCLPNDGHCSPDRAAARFGQVCASDLACKDTGFCMTVPGGKGYCTGPCQSGCPGAGVCGAGGLCTLVGGGSDGESCRVPGDCKSGACGGSTWRDGTCVRSCTGSCPGGELCGNDGVCHRPCSAGCPSGLTCDGGGLCRGPMDLGWPCATGLDCKRGECVDLVGLAWPAICTSTCEVPGDCTNGTGCAKTAKGNLCVPGKALALGSPCVASGSCGNGAACDLANPLGGYGVCVAACDPFGASQECAGGWCAWDPGGSGSGLCRAASGGRVVGQGCSAAEACRADLVCVQGSGSTGTCAEDCKVTAPDCALGLSCISLDGSGERGVCVDGGANATSVPLDTGSKYVNPDPRIIALPEVVPIAQWTPPVADATVAPAKGCQASPTTTDPSAGAVLSLMGVWILRRKRHARGPAATPAASRGSALRCH